MLPNYCNVSLQRNKLTHYDEKKKKKSISQIIRAKENLKVDPAKEKHQATRKVSVAEETRLSPALLEMKVELLVFCNISRKCTTHDTCAI